MKVSLQKLMESADITNDGGKGLNRQGPMSRLIQIEMNIPTSFRLTGIVGQINKYLEQFSQARLNLYKKHATFNEKTDSWDQNQAQEKAFMEDFSDLLAIEVEIAGDPITISDFSPSSKISSADLQKLSWLIKDDYLDIPVEPFVFRPSNSGPIS